jgi:L-iditol 2-dehydrogenase
VRVAVYYSNEDVRLEARPRPEIGPGEMLLRVEASGICGSDVMEWYRRPRAPLVLGHEVAGVVERTGEGVAEFRPGDRVVATHHVPCNRCRFCLSDRHAVCETLRTTHFDPGGFAEYVRLSPLHVDRGVFPLPAGVSFAQATFVEPLACVVRAQRLAGLRPGDSVAILGAGVSGLLHLLLARARGAGAIFATDVHDHRVRAAASLGADAALRAEGSVVEAIRRENGGRLVDRVIVCAASRAAMEQALALADRGASVLLFAPLAPGETLSLEVADLWQRGITLVTSYAGPPADMRAALELIAHRRVNPEPLVTHRLGLGETAEGFRLTAAAGDSLKVIVEPQR